VRGVHERRRREARAVTNTVDPYLFSSLSSVSSMYTFIPDCAPGTLRFHISRVVYTVTCKTVPMFGTFVVYTM